ncbi:MAG: metallophosphoesterase, partial [Dehalococcoidales bacterium]|nr:metallophosphoesterase [Dehalococcoidales bacterium]
RRMRSGGLRWLSVLILIIALPGILVPPVAFVYLEGIPFSGIGNTQPQLMIADGMGSYAIPNLAVTFNTGIATKNTLTWGTAEKVATLNEEKAARQHVFMLRNLEPGTGYWYRVNGGMKYSFTTPAVDGQLLHFAVGSDAHFGAGDSRNDLTGKMLNLIANPGSRYGLFFLLGDIVDRGFEDNQWNEAFQALSPTTSAIPTRFAVGNHDTLFTGLSDYEKYCYPQGMDIQTGSRLWYRIDVGKTHFLVIDLEWSAESYTSQQAKWLEEQLKSIPDNDWKIVMGHGFYYASGSIDNGWRWYDNTETIKALTPLFEKYKVDLVFSGHAHQLELLQKAGVSYVICGGFGGPPDAERTYKSPSSLWYASGDYGFVDVNLTPKEARIIFRTPDNSELETATIPKLEK